MKPRHLTWLVTAATLTALSASAQQTPPTDADRQPSQQYPAAQDDMGRDTSDPADTPPATRHEDAGRVSDDMGRPYDPDGSAEQPKKRKRSFWDRITGRNKHLDAEQPAPERQPGEVPTETRPQQP